MRGGWRGSQRANAHPLPVSHSIRLILTEFPAVDPFAAPHTGVADIRCWKETAPCCGPCVSNAQSLLPSGRGPGLRSLLSAGILTRRTATSFAMGMLWCALDPLGRNRGFLRMLAISGFLRAGERAVDNIRSAALRTTNGNPEHLYGDVLGWSIISAFAVSMLFLDRQPSLGPDEEGRTQPRRSVA